MATMSSQQGHTAREHRPIPDSKHVGLTTYDAKDPDTKYPPITMLRPPEVAPNVLIAASGVKLNRFHSTALCSPTRQAMLTGRNRHSVGLGVGLN